MIDAIVILCGQVMTVQREDVPTIVTETTACADPEFANVRKILFVSFIHHSLIRKKTSTGNVGFKGVSCAKPSCHGSNDCSSHGRCVLSGEDQGAFCECQEGYTGPACLEPDCINCQNGVCDNSVSPPICRCDEGFKGQFCDEKKCPNDCSGHGVCAEGLCTCYNSYYGTDCSKRSTCGDQCSAHGKCVGSYCACSDGWFGRDCMYTDRFEQNLGASTCPGACSGHGVCIDSKCHCDNTHTGKACDEKKCPQAHFCARPCCGRGVCVEGECTCLYGTSGDSCEIDASETCKDDCTGPDHGVCMKGKCHCISPYQGESCAEVTCPFDCHNRTY